MSPTYRAGSNLTSQSYEKNQFDQEKFNNFKFMISAVTIELHCNGKNLKSHTNLIFLDQTDFCHKTDWLSLVLLYMMVT